MLHKDATFKTYKTFLKHVETELSQNVESLEIRLPDTDDEKALTKAIEHVFPNATRYLCTKHLKDNVKHYLQNKVGVERKEREAIMNSIFGDDSIVDANSTIDFETRSSEINNKYSKEMPVFSEYFNSRLKPKLYEHVFRPNRQNSKKSPRTRRFDDKRTLRTPRTRSFWISCLVAFCRVAGTLISSVLLYVSFV